MLKKRYVVICIILLVLLAILPTYKVITNVNNNYKADYPYYSNVDSIIEQSDVIVLGRVNKIHKPKKININIDQNKKGYIEKEDDYSIYTITDIEVLEVLKGDLQIGDIIKVKQLGDENGRSEETLKKLGYFKDKEEHILFLSKYDDLLPEMPYSTLNPIQGNIKVEKEKIKKNNGNHLFEGIDNIYELTKTIKENK